MLCKDIIESKYRHNFVYCRCGEIFVDGGHDYLRRGAHDSINFLELSEYAEDIEIVLEDDSARSSSMEFMTNAST
jgi:hypothetical protein